MLYSEADLQMAVQHVQRIVKPESADLPTQRQVHRAIKLYQSAHNLATAREAKARMAQNAPALAKQVQLWDEYCRRRPRCLPGGGLAQLDTNGKNSGSEAGAVQSAMGGCERKKSGPVTVDCAIPDPQPYAVAWRHTNTCELASNTVRMFFAEDGESRPVQDSLWEAEKKRDQMLAMARGEERWTLTKVLSDWCCEPQAILAVCNFFDWPWPWVISFVLENPEILEAVHAALVPALQSDGDGGADGARGAVSHAVGVEGAEGQGGALVCAREACGEASGNSDVTLSKRVAEAVEEKARLVHQMRELGMMSPGSSRARADAVAAAEQQQQPSADVDGGGRRLPSQALQARLVEAHRKCPFVGKEVRQEAAGAPGCLGLPGAIIPVGTLSSAAGSSPAEPRRVLVRIHLPLQPVQETDAAGAAGLPGSYNLIDEEMGAAVCRRCGTFLCSRHNSTVVNANATLDGIPEGPDDEERRSARTARQKRMKAQEMAEQASAKRKAATVAQAQAEFKWHRERWQGPCSQHCFKIPELLAATKAAKAPVWSKGEVEMLNSCRAYLGPSPCILAPMIFTKTCVEVQLQLEQLEQPAAAGVARGAVEAAATKQGPTPAAVQAMQAAPRRRKASKPFPLSGPTCTGGRNGRVAPAALKRRYHDQLKPWSEYTPCSCDPARGCDTTCPCAVNENYCEKWCACGGTCNNVHRGCSCTSSCVVMTCPCMDAGRECDPERCRNCTATAHGLLRDEERVCNNMSMRLGMKRKVAMGRSGVAGWGCFMLEDVSKGEFIGEYTGELLSAEECDRRGQVYDMMNSSYLFQLNAQWALDARKVGNKLRFANHSKANNAFARVMLVDGDHHVGIYAKVDLKAGDEVFYDYGYHSADCYCPKWGDEPKKARRMGTLGAAKKQPFTSL